MAVRLALSQPLVIRPDCTISVREGLWLVALGRTGDRFLVKLLPCCGGVARICVHWLQAREWEKRAHSLSPFPSLQWAFSASKSRWILEGAAHTSESKTAAYSNDNGFSVGDRSQPIKVKPKVILQDVHRIETLYPRRTGCAWTNRSWSRALAEKILASVELNRIDFLEEPWCKPDRFCRGLSAVHGSGSRWMRVPGSSHLTQSRWLGFLTHR